LTTFIINFWDSKQFSLLHNGNTLPSFLLFIQCIIRGHMRTGRFWWKPLIKWQICGDLTVIALLLGLKLGFTKCRCFFYERDSRPRSLHYSRKDWPTRKSMEPRIMNVENQPLVEPSKILLPFMHLSLGLMKNFVKAMN
jgi:hypothetical protein